MQEAIQEVFLQYFAERVQNREISDRRAWLFRMLRGYLQENRQQSRVPLAVSMEGLGEIVDRTQNPESDLHHKEVWSRISSAMSPGEFECFCLRAEGLSYQAIAEAMGIRPATVGVVMWRGLRKLHRLL